MQGVFVALFARIEHTSSSAQRLRLLLSTTTELVILNPLPQHDPHPDSQFASHRGSRLPETFLNQFAAVEMFQLRIPAYRMDHRFTPEKAQQRITLFGQAT